MAPPDGSSSSMLQSGESASQRVGFLGALLSRLEPSGEDEESLNKWRQASLVLNSARRFRYTAGGRDEQRFKVGSLALRAAMKFKKAAGISTVSGAATADAKKQGFEFGAEQLSELLTKNDTQYLSEMGGPEGICRGLQVDTKSGISGSKDDIQLRQDVFGTNTFPEKQQKSFLGFVWDAMQDVTLLILAVCAVTSLAVGIPTEGWQEGWYDGAGIGFSVAIVVLVTAVSDYQQSLQFRELENEKKKIFVQTQRKGRRQKVLIFDLVVGDVVHLSIGDQVPGDGIYLKGYNLTIDESSMTGESDPQHKDEDNPFLLSGTKVQDGSADMVLTGVGMNTEWGHLMASLSEGGEEETPLQVRLSGVATLVGRLGLGVALLVFLVLLTRFFISKDSWTTWTGEEVIKIVRYFAIAVTIIVVAVPEGLPLAVTLTLAYAMKRMMRDMALVRKLAACETMGSATTICSDKTGTLTTNKMTVVKLWAFGCLQEKDQLKQGIDAVAKDNLLEHIFTNTSGDIAEEDGKVDVLGTPTESAVLRLGLELNGDFKEVREKFQVVHEEPFSSAKKRMAVVVKLPDGNHRVHWKGAAEIVLGQCKSAATQDGSPSTIDAAKREELDGVIQQFADQSLRALCLATRDLASKEVPKDGNWKDVAIPDSDLTALAIVGIKDPMREGVKHSVELCKSAGIKVRMVTGDNLSTAKAIARECGILFDNGVAIEGPVFRKLSQEEMREVIPKLQVMARAHPSDKITLVKELRAMGQVVAVTGDGTNDAPALHEADIGLAMGIAGTEVAKESADIIIMDDNFATIVNVAKWGRSVYTNIQKFVQFQLTVNIVALVINFVSACITGEAPLTAVQLLWVNLIMDTLGALALATEPPNDTLMTKPPVGRVGAFISPIMWRNIFGQAIYQLAVLGVMQIFGARILGFHGEDREVRLNTMIFNSFVFCQVFNEINSRQMERINVLSGFFTNVVFLGVIFFTVIFQFVLVQYLGKFASTVPLSVREWAICVGLGFASMPVAAVVKCIPVGEVTPQGPGRRASKHINRNGYTPLPGSEADERV
eukprot:SM000057S18439  [mRNA]  locus=s57:592183:598957:+ [translate_table: standard]